MTRQTWYRIAISIHALREEGDGVYFMTNEQMTISIHALREEGDLFHARKKVSMELFLSTPSVRRATLLMVANFLMALVFLSTPSVRRATCTQEVL